MPQPADPIGIYDSGVGGLSVLREIRAQLPAEDLIFFGDQGHAPYGSRSLAELRSLAESVTRWMLGQQVKLLVIACNTASAAALKHLRQAFPDLPIVGMEPAVKPAAEQTHSGKVGVLATPTTFAGELYASVLERFAHDVTVMQDTCPGLVAQIELGRLDTPKTRRILEDALRPMLDAGVDTLVMGCTHYPFVIPLIEEIVAGQARVIDPAPAVARQTARVLSEKSLLNPSPHNGTLRLYTSGNANRLHAMLPRLINESAEVSPLSWHDGSLKTKPINRR